MSVSVFVFFNITDFFFLLSTSFTPQDFSFSVLCLALNACICFGVVFFPHAGPQLSSANFLYICHCYEIVTWKSTFTCLL